MDTNKMRDICREQFEAWHRSVVDGEPPHEKYNNGDYRNQHVQRYWLGWQASREAVMLELPNRAAEAYREEFDDVEGGSFNEAAYIRDVRKAIEAQGLKVAP